MFDYKLALQQLVQRQNAYGTLKVMIGAKNFLYNPDANSVTFKFQMFRKAPYCRLQYDAGLDLYNMSFIKCRKIRDKLLPSAFWKEEAVTVEEFKGLSSEDLKEAFESFTGLRLTL